LTDVSNSSSVTSCDSSEPGSPSAQSSPSKLPSGSSNSASSLRTLTINFRSLFGKKEELWSLIDAVNPDIVFGCETWLKPGISRGEIFPLGYNVYRKDRRDGYGGVLLGISTSLISHQLDLDTETDFIAAKVLNGNDSIIVGALYRPTDNNQQYMDSLNQIIEYICHSNPNTAVWIGGDANLPDIDWTTNQVVGHQYRKEISESHLNTLGRLGLEQIVDFPTRLDNTLDVVITNRPSLVNHCVGMPGLSDHDIVYMDMNVKATRQKPVRHKIFLWKRADFNSIRSVTKEWSNNFISAHTTSTPVEDLADEIQHFLDKILEEQVPSKFATTRFNQPWCNTVTKRICRRKARAYKKARRTKKSCDWSRFNRLKKEAQATCRQRYNQYLSSIINSDPGGNKRLGALIKAKRCDQTGVAPLREGNLVHSDPKAKANILNRQFASVFTDDRATQLPDLGHTDHPALPNIKVNCMGVIKLLKNLKPHKATGPDGIPARLLKEIAEEIAPAITLLFQASLDQGTLPCSWKKALVVPVFKKGKRSAASNYRPISLTAIVCKLCEHIV
jgi:hypothetical protein